MITETGKGNNLHTFGREMRIGKAREYLETFLCSPHPHRNGAVCPFMQTALRKNVVQVVAYEDISREGDEINTLTSFIRKHRHDILADGYAAIVIVMSAQISISMLTRIHRTLHKHSLNEGLLLGMFHPESNVISLHNDDYYPNRSGLPLLALRNISSPDLEIAIKKAGMPTQKKLELIGTFLSNSPFATTKDILHWKNIAAKLRCKYHLRIAVSIVCLACILAYLALGISHL